MSRNGILIYLATGLPPWMHRGVAPTVFLLAIQREYIPHRTRIIETVADPAKADAKAGIIVIDPCLISELCVSLMLHILTH